MPKRGGVVGRAGCVALGWVAAVVIGPRVVTAQGLSGAYGIAVDSIHGGVLAGAVVMVLGTARQGIADSTGKFRIDSVPPGRHRLELFHPLLDSIGFDIRTPAIDFRQGRYAVVAMATPSSATLVSRVCPPPDSQHAGRGLILGRVTDADTDEPVPGATVSFTWMELEVGQEIGVRHVPRIAEAPVDASGAFQICGLPERARGVLRAGTPRFATGDVPTAFTTGLVQVVVLHVSPDTGMVAEASDGGGVRQGRATLTGVVSDSAGVGIPGAHVTVVGAASTATTNATGHFVLGDLPAGTQTLLVRRLPYAPTALAVELSSVRPQMQTVRLARAARPLDTIRVTAFWEQQLQKVGFAQRLKRGIGSYQTREQIEAQNPQNITDMFQMTPGLTVDYSTGWNPRLKASRGGGGCVNYVIDGMPYKEQTAGDINDYLQPSEIEATEVYHPEEVPAEFEQAGATSCMTVVIWTKVRVGDFR